MCRLGKKNSILDKIPKFYADILIEWNSIQENTSIENLDYKGILSESLWYNNYITIENQSFFWKEWYDSGIKHVYDILNEHGDFLDAEGLSGKYGVKATFMQVLQLRKALPYIWRKKLITAKLPVTFVPIVTVFVMDSSSRKNFITMTAKELYWIIWKRERLKHLPKSMIKWNENFDLSTNDWKYIFRNPFESCTSTVFQCFQYKILHRIIPCKHWLFNLNVIESPNCHYCGEDETVVHFFFSCTVLEQFWNSFTRWWINLTGTFMKTAIYDLMVIFGVKSDCDNAVTFNYCMIVAKYYIYTNRLQEVGTFNFYRFLPFLKSRLNEEYLYYSDTGQLEKFYKTKGLIFENL